MAHSNSARKRIRQNAKHRALNRWRLKAMRSAIRDFQTTLAQGSVADAATAFRAAAKAIDRTAAKGVIHKSQAARRKSRLNARLKAKATA